MLQHEDGGALSCEMGYGVFLFLGAVEEEALGWEEEGGRLSFKRNVDGGLVRGWSHNQTADRPLCDELHRFEEYSSLVTVSLRVYLSIWQ